MAALRPSACILLFLPLLAHAQTYEPPSYVVYRTAEGVEVDGRITDSDWGKAEWTTDFIDIEGSHCPIPRFRTRAKLLWDDQNLYVAAELEEPHVWATLTERDSRVYEDNAFEVFIDPDGDRQNYYELEINAVETVWDLLLVKPHREGGPSLSAWDIRGMQARVHVQGTVNDPSDIDSGWTVELSLPWSVLREAAPERRRPKDGESWRLNFARSEWMPDIVDGQYRKQKKADWWVWSSQGAVDMHRPERFGFAIFSDEQVGQAGR